MDWESYERYRATFLLIGVAFISFLLLAFQRTSAVKHLRAFLVVCTLPTERFLTDLNAVPTAPSRANVQRNPADLAGRTDWAAPAEEQRALRVLSDENARLRELLEL